MNKNIIILLVNKLGNLFKNYIIDYVDYNIDLNKSCDKIIEIFREILDSELDSNSNNEWYEMLIFFYLNFIKFFPKNFYQIEMIKDLKLLYKIKENNLNLLKIEVSNGYLKNWKDYLGKNQSTFSEFIDLKSYIKLLVLYECLLDINDENQKTKIIEKIKSKKTDLEINNNFQFKEKEIKEIFEITLGNLDIINEMNDFNFYISYFLYFKYDEINWKNLKNLSFDKDCYINNMIEIIFRPDLEIKEIVRFTHICKIIFIKFFLEQKSIMINDIKNYFEIYKNSLKELLNDNFIYEFDYEIIMILYEELKTDLDKEHKFDELYEITTQLISKLVKQNKIKFELLNKFIDENILEEKKDEIYLNIFKESNFETKIRILGKLKDKNLIENCSLKILECVNKFRDQKELINNINFIEKNIRLNNITLLILNLFYLKYFQIKNDYNEIEKILYLIKKNYDNNYIFYYPKLLMEYFLLIKFIPQDNIYEDMIKNILNDYLFLHKDIKEKKKIDLLNYTEFI